MSPLTNPLTRTLFEVNVTRPRQRVEPVRLGTMSKRLISLVVSNALVLFLCVGTSVASSREEKEAKLAADVKAGITKLGTGPTALVEIKLRDKTKLKGHVQEIAEDHFIVIDDRTGAATTVAYPQVKQIKGNNLSTGAKIAITLVIIGVLFAIAGSGGP